MRARLLMAWRVLVLAGLVASGCSGDASEQVTAGPGEPGGVLAPGGETAGPPGVAVLAVDGLT